MGLREHVVGGIAAIVERRLRVVIVLGDEHFGHAGKTNVKRAAFAREADHVKLGAGRHLAAGIVQRVDFGMHHERVLVRLELVVAQEFARIGIEQVVGQQLLFAGVRDGLVVKTRGGSVVTGTYHAALGAHEHCAHLGILVFTEARLGAHHLGIYFVTKLAAGLRIVHALKYSIEQKKLPREHRGNCTGYEKKAILPTFPSRRHRQGSFR